MNLDTNKQAQIAIRIPAKLYESLKAKADEAKQSVTGYSTLLFQAAASERVKPGSAPDLHDAIARVVVLWGSRQLNTDEIGRLVGLSEMTVARILDGWRREISGKAA